MKENSSGGNYEQYERLIRETTRMVRCICPSLSAHEKDELVSIVMEMLWREPGAQKVVRAGDEDHIRRLISLKVRHSLHRLRLRQKRRVDSETMLYDEMKVLTSMPQDLNGPAPQSSPAVPEEVLAVLDELANTLELWPVLEYLVQKQATSHLVSSLEAPAAGPEAISLGIPKPLHNQLNYRGIFPQGKRRDDKHGKRAEYVQKVNQLLEASDVSLEQLTALFSSPALLKHPRLGPLTVQHWAAYVRQADQHCKLSQAEARLIRQENGPLDAQLLLQFRRFLDLMYQLKYRPMLLVAPGALHLLSAGLASNHTIPLADICRHGHDAEFLWTRFYDLVLKGGLGSLDLLVAYSCLLHLAGPMGRVKDTDWIERRFEALRRVTPEYSFGSMAAAFDRYCLLVAHDPVAESERLLRSTTSKGWWGGQAFVYMPLAMFDTLPADLTLRLEQYSRLDELVETGLAHEHPMVVTSTLRYLTDRPAWRRPLLSTLPILEKLSRREDALGIDRYASIVLQQLRGGNTC